VCLLGQMFLAYRHYHNIGKHAKNEMKNDDNVVVVVVDDDDDGE
jgi:hypothetical protein